MFQLEVNNSIDPMWQDFLIFYKNNDADNLSHLEDEVINRLKMYNQNHFSEKYYFDMINLYNILAFILRD